MRNSSVLLLLVIVLIVALVQILVSVLNIGVSWLQPVLWTALAVMTVVLVAVYVRGYVQSASLSGNSKDVPQSSDEEQQAYEFMARRYGISYDSMDVQCEVFDDGSVEVRRHLRLRAYSDIHELDNFLSLTPDEGTAEGKPQVEVDSVGQPKIRIKQELVSEGRSYVVLGIAPPLSNSESAQYVLRERVSTEFYKVRVGKAEQEKRAKKREHDYFGWRVSRPTKLLSIRVIFPRGITPEDYSSKVYVGSVVRGIGDQREQHQERSRVGEPELELSDRGNQVLKLIVDYPAVGLIYVIQWNPPTEDINHSAIGPAQSQSISASDPDQVEVI